MKWYQRKPESPARESAQDLVGRLFGLVATLDEIERRELARLDEIERRELAGSRNRAESRSDRWKPGNAILTVLDEANVGEQDRRKLVRSLQRIRDRARSYIVAIGDDRRADAQETPRSIPATSIGADSLEGSIDETSEVALPRRQADRRR
jgi:hypothetical protein